MGIDESLLASLAADAAYINAEAEAADKKIQEVERELVKAHCGAFEWPGPPHVAFRRVGNNFRLCTGMGVPLSTLSREARVNYSANLDAFVEALAADVKRRREEIEGKP